MAAPLPIIDARGSYREIGRQIGEAAREQIRRSIAYSDEHIDWLTGMSLAEAERRSLALLPYAERFLPHYVEELAGLAEGAGLPFAKLVVANCGEELLCAPRPKDRCTCMALATPGNTVVGHNEDWIEADIENMVLLRVTMSDGTRFLSLTGAAYLPMCGMNSHGIAFVGNTIYANDERAGVPNSFKHRWMLEAADRAEADARACLPERSRGSNHLFAQAGGQIWDLEVSASRSVVIEPEPEVGIDGQQVVWLAHANHFTADEMSGAERSDSLGSRHRLARARELLTAGIARGDDPVALVTSVLTDHANAPTSICAHPVPDDPQDGPTTGSLIFELEERRMHVCAGRPCENAYRIVSMD